ncbi:XRE family transcriptional regulator of molybdate metabolism [Methylacidiphilum kamchatkense Kam1]|uniref:XRE family transcriptional regulator of molybdate metabolism n=2 Tax=Methylacidiphilum kamchatkense TaxID=431057 RepID=A0A516TN33_9BACT|nr:XRE family transcriptional regulator of molybdate metabolism [Methylacidiphilum kamchatkense Kam1]
MHRKMALKDSLINNPLRLTRIGKGLSQKELASKIGVSRQTIHAMESGRYVPNTAVALRLARVLGKSVEFLFPYSPDFVDVDCIVGMDQQNTHTEKSPERLVVGEVRGKKIAWPSTSLDLNLGYVEANAFRVRSEGNCRQLRLLCPYSEIEKQIFLVGCDPALGMLSNRLARYSDFKLWWFRQPSLKALSSLQLGFAHVGGFHFPKEHPKNNIASGTEALAKTGGLIFAFSKWEEGFVVKPGNPLRIRQIEDLLRKNVRFVNREDGSGTRILLDSLLNKAEIQPDQINGYRIELPTALDVAKAVGYGFADVGLSSRACAEITSLDFVPLYEMEFWLAIPHDLILQPAVEKFLDFLKSGDLKNDLALLPGYSFEALGEIVKEVQ